MTLVEFLRARLGEDEWLATAAEKYDGQDMSRVVADVEAKRSIIDAYQRHDELSSDPCESCWAQGLGEAVRLLALPYREHRDYQQDWMP